MTHEEIEKRMEELPQLYAETQDEKAKAELEHLSRQLAGLLNH